MRITRIRPSFGLISALVLTAAVSFGWATSANVDRVAVPRDDFVLFPRGFVGWQGFTTPLETEIEEVLGADDYLNAIYQSTGEDQSVAMFVAYYDDQTAGEGIHSPEICLPVGGWEIFSLDRHAVDMTDVGYGRFDLNRAVIQKGTALQLVYYWFEQRGQRISNDFVAKASVMKDAVLTGRTDGALVRFVTPIGAAEQPGQADARLQRFMKDSLRTLPRFVPM